MKSGAINIVIEPGQGLSANSAPLERHEEGQTLRSTIQLATNYAQTTLSDMTIEDGELEATTITEGTVLRDELVDMKIHRVSKDGNLEVTKEGKEIQVNETPFIYADDQVLITARTGADAARNIVETFSSSAIKEASIDIPTFAEAHPEADSVLEWGRNGDDGLTICAVGDISSDSDLRRRLNTSQRAQMSFRNLNWDGRRLYGTITKSGYVEIYRDENGGNVGSEEFTRFVLEEVIEHAFIPSEPQIHAD